MRGATSEAHSRAGNLQHFNPRAPCGARRYPTLRPFGAIAISTHAPLAGRDYKAQYHHQATHLFQPTRPLRGATLLVDSGSSAEFISTHAPLAGRDEKQQREAEKELKFQPTRPLRGATSAPPKSVICTIFQPTRPLRGATFKASYDDIATTNFNPRAPCGARRSVGRFAGQFE